MKSLPTLSPNTSFYFLKNLRLRQDSRLRIKSKFGVVHALAKPLGYIVLSISHPTFQLVQNGVKTEIQARYQHWDHDPHRSQPLAVISQPCRAFSPATIQSPQCLTWILTPSFLLKLHLLGDKNWVYNSEPVLDARLRNDHGQKLLNQRTRPKLRGRGERLPRCCPVLSDLFLSPSPHPSTHAQSRQDKLPLTCLASPCR